MINAQPGISPISIAEVIPESIDLLVGIQFAKRIRPTLFNKRLERKARFGPEEGIVHPSFRFVHIELGRHHVEVAR